MQNTFSFCTVKRLCLPHTCEQGITQLTMFRVCSTGFLLVGGTNEKALLKSSIIQCSKTPRRLTFFFPHLVMLSRGISRERISNYLFEKKTSTVFLAATYLYLHLPRCFCCYNMTDRPCQNACEGVYEDIYGLSKPTHGLEVIKSFNAQFN